MLLLNTLILVAALFEVVTASTTLRPWVSSIVPIASLFDNRAASTNGSVADFDGLGSSYDAQFLPSGLWNYDGITYDLPLSWGQHDDNVIANGQILPLPKLTYVHELHFVLAGDAQGNEFVANFVLNFADNSTQELQMYAQNWWRWPLLYDGAIQTPYHFELNGTQKNWNSSQIYQWSTAIPTESALQSITFPKNNPARRLHIFAMSISSSVTSGERDIGPALSVRRARFTSRWELVGGRRAQAVEVTLANLLPSSAFSHNTSISSRHEIEISGPGIRTVSPGVFYRLVPSDQVRVDVLVTGGIANGIATVQIRDSDSEIVGTSGGWTMSPLVERWPVDASVLSTHETPTWWNKAKYGIFIHWGVYSYPAWAPPGSYAEWYDWYLHNPPNSSNPTWNHHLETFGENVVYDDFIPNFTASKFNASAWVNLFDQAGAKYFVLVTKHHDGFALFDTGETTHRSSVHFGPHRDLVAELLETAKKEKPELHRGTYYSLPEWFSPDYAPYGFGQWPGGLAHNAYDTSEIEPYTGRLNISNYLDDLQLPQMLDLATKYETEIMWCDIGGPNKTLEFAAEFYNNAMANGRQVTMNNRCGAVPDFDTPEYATFGSIQTRKWESSEGMDPFSYGLNSATNATQYKNGTTIVQTLVDIASKNGNYLLDIGPTADGEIIAPMADNLLDAGAWLKYAGDCVYNTEYWFSGSQDPDPQLGTVPPRFLTTPETFCIVAFSKPADGTLVVNKRLPILPGDEIVFLSPTSTNSSLPWSLDDAGRLTVDVTTSDIDSVQYAWAFQIRYKIQ